jgi:hypothetical protein
MCTLHFVKYLNDNFRVDKLSLDGKLSANAKISREGGTSPLNWKVGHP